MPSNRRIKRDDFDIESMDRFQDRGRKSRTSESRTRSRSRKRSYSRRVNDGSRSRSRSLEFRGRRRNRDISSRSRSRSHGHSRHSDRRHTSRKYRDSRSRSNSRSRSKSKSYCRQRSGRYRYDDDDGDREQYRRKSSNSRSRSRSSSHFRDFEVHDTNNLSADTPSKPSTSLSPSALSSKIPEENTHDDLEDLPLPQQKSTDKKSNGPYQFDENEPIDRARIHREIEEKLRAELAKEGKVYPPPKLEASHPVFANDGSFLEIFKKMQEASTSSAAATAKPIVPAVPAIAATASPSTAPYLAAAATGKSAPPPPLVGRRRGGKILKTGVVAKPKIQTDANADPKDFWSLYLAEVNKYKNTACESEQGNRPLVK